LTGLYLFAAAAGLPVVAWFLLSGGDEGGGDEGGIGGVMFRLLPLSTIAIAVATFGVAGLALGAVGTGSATTLTASLVAAAVVGALNSTVFAYLRRSESTASVEDRQLVGAVGRVVLPITGEHRGRVAVSVGGQQLYLSARALPGEANAELEVGASVLVIEVSGGVAGVTRLDAELE
jgi:membrane protein implicated in regulation of membrane protease activity